MTGAPRPRVAMIAGTAFVVLALVDLVAVGVGNTAVAAGAQSLLMPALAIAFVAATPPPQTPGTTRLRRATLAAILLSWAGDVLPRTVSGDASFLVMVGGFLLAQIAFIVAFAPMWRRSLVRRAPIGVVPYLVTLVALVVACADGAGPLLVPVVVYGATLTVMAVLATGVNRWTGVGAVIFLVSDSLIALGNFRSWGGAGLSVAIMSTYCVAEAMIALGVRRSLIDARVDGTRFRATPSGSLR